MTTTKEFFVIDRRAVREAFGKSDKDVITDITIVREWCEIQPHLPEVPNDNMIEIFLAMNKFSIQMTKEKLDMYYTIRSLIPEIYDASNPKLPHMRNISETMGVSTTLPKQTKEHCRVLLFRLIGCPDDFDVGKFVGHMFNVMEMCVQHDIATGTLFLIDHQQLAIGHVMKITPTYVKKFAIILEKVFSNRVKGIHVINFPPFVDLLMTIAKAVLKPKLFARIYLHKNIEGLYEYIPREILPKDYGGEERSVEELNELWKKVLVENSERFDKLDKLRVNEEFRPVPLQNDEILGYHGNFKKLDVD